MLSHLLEQVDSLQSITPYEANAIKAIGKDEAFSPEIESALLLEIPRARSNKPVNESFFQRAKNMFGRISPLYQATKGLEKSMGQLGEGILALNHALKAQSESQKDLLLKTNENMLKMNHNIERLNQSFQERLGDLKLIIRGLIDEILQYDKLFQEQTLKQIEEEDVGAASQVGASGKQSKLSGSFSINKDSLGEAIYFIAVCK